MLDVIKLGNSPSVDYKAEENTNTVSHYMRHREIHKTHKDIGDLVEFMQAHPDVQYRYLIQPEGNLIKWVLGMLNFDFSYTNKM